jgi:hypothetical protein
MHMDENGASKGEVLGAFFLLCQDVNLAWRAWNHLFRGRAGQHYLRGRFPYGMEVIAKCISNQVLAGVARIHDPATQGSNQNLSVHRVVENLEWTVEQKAELVEIVNKMEGVAQNLKKLRHKVLAHNDLNTIMNSRSIGLPGNRGFRVYFEILQQLVNRLGEFRGLGIQPLDVGMVENDLHLLRAILVKDSLDFFRKL